MQMVRGMREILEDCAEVQIGANRCKLAQKVYQMFYPCFTIGCNAGKTPKRKKKMIRISLIHDHYKRTPKGEEGPIEVRVTINRKAHYINTGVRVRAERLVGNAVRDMYGSHDADLLNERLTTIVRLVESEVNRCLDSRMPIDVKAIKQKVWGLTPVEDSDSPTLLAWIKEMASTANISSTTKKRYQTLINKLVEYGQLTRWEHLSPENIYGFDVWLRQQYVPLTQNQKDAGLEPEHISSDTVYNYHKCLKAMLNRALKFGKISVNPYDRMKGEFKRTRRDVVDYLTEEQMFKVMELTPVPGSQVAMARDLFIFQMFTGLAYSDTQAFDISKYREVDGEWRFIGERIKTGVPYVSTLLPPVVEVLERNGWRVPKMTNQRYNQLLKAIGMVIGIERLHSHMGRHSFATWMLSNDAKIENVSRMLGHTNIVQTQRYAKVLAKDVYDDFEKVANKLRTKK
jgi:integrase